MKKLSRFLATLLALIMMFSLVACGANPADTSADASNGSTAPAEGDTIRLGFVGPLTGDSAAWGIAQLKAIQIQVDKTNQDGGLLGKQIELFYYDNRDEAVESVNATRKLIENDNVACIIGPNSSVCALSMSSVCEEYQVPMIATNCMLESVTIDDNGNVRPYTFRSIMIQKAYTKYLVDYLTENTDYQTAACLYKLSDDQNVIIVQQFTEDWEATGRTVTCTETTASADDVDFRAQLTKIIATNPDVIFTPFNYKQIILMAQQARELGFKGQFVGCDTWFQVNIPESAGEQVEGCVAIASLDVNDPILDPIKDEWQEYWGEIQTLEDGGTDPYYGYDSYMMFVKAVEDANATDAVSIRDALETLKDVQGCVGLLTVDPETHNPNRQLAIVTVSKKADGSGYEYQTLGTAFDGEITMK